ncbi:hypothetical protein QBC33DRAFT_558529 [Phialemonium atrogriseum]|uniref:Uncharacterized protein n=1 Tax=Phialemonium atrogriseum TaxID=1093897 RepID=A0AAJ0C032_9PEZI|nr:uncharacterized protein QBC33DRAFT_558529 [Phialemonium atrogriseum]KAK1767693.1 hypothetical protein QBC33DRAFT_558529 [Phialemonium atrogriseum]
MSLHTGSQGWFEHPRTPPSPSSQYSSRVVSTSPSVTATTPAPASREEDAGATHHPHPPLDDDDDDGPHLPPATIDPILDTLLARLHAAHLRRQATKHALHEAEQAAEEATWRLLLLDHRHRHHPPGRARGRLEYRLALARAGRDGATARRRRELGAKLGAATAEVEDDLGVLWRVLRERARRMKGEERGGGSGGSGRWDGDADVDADADAGGGGGGSVVEQVRRLLGRASAGELEEARALLDRQLLGPAALSVRSPAAGVLTPPPRSHSAVPWASGGAGQGDWSGSSPVAQTWI